MKITVSKTELLRAAEIAGRAINLKSSLPIYSALLMAADETGVRLTGTDGELTLSAARDTESFTTGGKVAVVGDSFLTMVKALKGPEIQIEQTKSALIVKSGRARYSLPIISGQAWPVFPEVKPGLAFRIDAGALAAALARVAPAMGSDASRPIFCGICWKISGGRLELVATDTHRLHVAHLPVSEGVAGELVLGASAARELARVLEAGECDVVTDGAALKVHGAWGSFTAMLVHGTYPEYARFIPLLSTSITVEREEFIEAVKRAGLVAQSGADRLVFGIDAAGATSIDVASDAHGAGCEELVGTPSEGWAEQRFAASWRYLLAAAAGVPDERLTLYKSTGVRGIALTGNNPEQYLAVVMPMRLPDEA